MVYRSASVVFTDESGVQLPVGESFFFLAPESKGEREGGEERNGRTPSSEGTNETEGELQLALN